MSFTILPPRSIAVDTRIRTGTQRGDGFKWPGLGEWIAISSPFTAIGLLWAVAILGIPLPLPMLAPLIDPFLYVAILAAAGGATGGLLTHGTLSDRLATATKWSAASCFISVVLLLIIATTV